MTSEVETNIVAVERIKEYGETPQVMYLNIVIRLNVFIYVVYMYIFRKPLGIYPQICHPRNGQQEERFNLKILKCVIVKD